MDRFERELGENFADALSNEKSSRNEKIVEREGAHMVDTYISLVEDMKFVAKVHANADFGSVTEARLVADVLEESIRSNLYGLVCIETSTVKRRVFSDLSEMMTSFEWTVANRRTVLDAILGSEPDFHLPEGEFEHFNSERSMKLFHNSAVLEHFEAGESIRKDSFIKGGGLGDTQDILNRIGDSIRHLQNNK